MLKDVVVEVLADLATAHRVLSGEEGVPETPGMSQAESRTKVALEVIEGAGTMLADALDVVRNAEMMLASLVTSLPTFEVEEEERQPFGFAAYHWANEQAAKAA